MPPFGQIAKAVAYLRSEIPTDDVSKNPIVQHPHNTTRGIPERLPDSGSATGLILGTVSTIYRPLSQSTPAVWQTPCATCTRGIASAPSATSPRWWRALSANDGWSRSD